MSTLQQTVAMVAAGVLVTAAGCNRAPEALTPEAARAKGDALVQEMSKNLAALQAFSYTTDERREIVGSNGTKTEKRTSRNVTIRRPNSVALTSTGEGDVSGWYDGKSITLVSAKAKVWVRGPMPPTLDEALDFLSSEYAVQVPSADLLYSSPYDALITKDSTGGWVDVQTIGGDACDHVAYKQESVDWELWIGGKRHLPCQFKIVYKTEPSQPATTVTYSNFNPSPSVTDDTFTAKVPDGFQRIKIMRHATVNDPKVVEASSEPAAAPAPKKKSR